MYARTAAVLVALLLTAPALAQQAPSTPPAPPTAPSPPAVQEDEAESGLEERLLEMQQRALERSGEAAERAKDRMRQAERRLQARIHADADDRVALGSSVTVKAGETVADVVAWGGTITVEPGAVVTGDAVAFGGTVELQNGVVVEGDAVAFGGSVVVRSGAIVRGDTSSFGGSIEVEEGAIIEGSRVGLGAGKTARRILPFPGVHGDEADDEAVAGRHARSERGWVLSGILQVLYTTVQFLVLLVLGFLLLATMPRRLDRMRRPLAGGILKPFLAGLLALIAFVPLVVLLVVSLVGILLIPVLLLAYVVLFFLGWVVVALAAGRRIPGSFRRTPGLELIAGVGAFWVIALFAQLPWIGWLFAIVLFVAALTGMGAVILARFGNQPRPTAGEMHPPPEYTDQAGSI